MGSCWSGSSHIEVESARHRNVDKTIYHNRAVKNVQNPVYTVGSSHVEVESARHRNVDKTIYHNRAVNNVQNPVYTVVPSRASKPCYGEYTCPRCGHSWHSLLSWRNVCQACRICGTDAHPRNQREVRSSDITRRKDSYHKHPQELCQRCQQLGYHCSNSIKKYP